MKKLYYSSIVLFASLFSFTACSSDDVNGNSVADGKLITVNTAIGNAADSRVAYDDNNTNNVTVSWSTSEKFQMYQGTSGSGITFTKSAAGNVFGGSIPTDGSGSTYYCVYPYDIAISNGVLTIDLSNQTGTKDENGIKEFMLATSTDLSGTLTFEHKLTVLKLILTLPSEVTAEKVDKVTVTGMHNKATYSLSDDAYETMTNENKGTITATNGTDGFTITNKTITAYVSVFPEDVTANSIRIGANVGGVDYFCYMTNAANLSVQVGNLVPVTKTSLTRQNAKATYTKSDYFYWDAYEYVGTGTTDFSDGNYGYNNTTNANNVVNSCKDCPTASQMVAYLKAGVYWDDNTTVTEGLQIYSAPDGASETKSDQHTGLWIKKRSLISDFDTQSDETYETAGNNTFTKLSTITDADKVKRIRTGGDYFFLPAAGNYYGSGSFGNAGSGGYYWSSTPFGNSDYAYYLYFSSDLARVGLSSRERGYLPWCVE